MYAFVSPSGDVQFGSSPIPVPPGAVAAAVPSGVALDALVWTGDALVDRATVTTWHVDKFGNKHAFQADPAWQAVACGWTDVLAETAGAWAVKAVDLRAYAAAARYARETGGIAVGGVKVATDEASQAKITGAYVKAGRDGAFTTAWKGMDGTFAVLDATAILAVGDAVAAHVAACFAAEAQVDQGIAAGSVKTAADVDAAFAAVAT